jgi:hypothetical protein
MRTTLVRVLFACVLITGALAVSVEPVAGEGCEPPPVPTPVTPPDLPPPDDGSIPDDGSKNPQKGAQDRNKKGGQDHPGGRQGRDGGRIGRPDLTSLTSGRTTVTEAPASLPDSTAAEVLASSEPPEEEPITTPLETLPDGTPPRVTTVEVIAVPIRPTIFTADIIVSNIISDAPDANPIEIITPAFDPSTVNTTIDPSVFVGDAPTTIMVEGLTPRTTDLSNISSIIQILSKKIVSSHTTVIIYSSTASTITHNILDSLVGLFGFGS